MKRHMKDIDEIRRENMRRIEQEVGGPSAAAQAAGMRTTSQWINLRNGAPDSKTGKPRGMHKSTARKLERCFQKPGLWIDTDHSHEPAPADQPDSAKPSIREALDTVLDAIASSPDRAELRQLLPMLVDTNAQAYRERLHQLLDGLAYSPTIERVIRAKLHAETRDITTQGTHTDAGSHD